MGVSVFFFFVLLWLLLELWIARVLQGDLGIREKGVLTPLEHAGGKVPHYGLGLHGEVSEHLIRAPATKEADCVRVDMGTQKGHCAGGAEGTCTDFGVMEADGRTQSTNGSL
jgi:hypothetical protein